MVMMYGVGSHVLINGGIKVGNGAVIGAGAVVVKDVPAYAVVGEFLQE
ncbi:hypothetical protein [Bacteroides faecis]|nr:hypothetical protein [Bacteroides faecis]